jgi:superfamily II DNA/RNA helicase
LIEISFVRVLVMTPTRELAKQIAFEFEAILGKGDFNSTLNVLTVYGGR